MQQARKHYQIFVSGGKVSHGGGKDDQNVAAIHNQYMSKILIIIFFGGGNLNLNFEGRTNEDKNDFP